MALIIRRSDRATLVAPGSWDRDPAAIELTIGWIVPDDGRTPLQVQIGSAMAQGVHYWDEVNPPIEIDQPTEFHPWRVPTVLWPYWVGRSTEMTYPKAMDLWQADGFPDPVR